jgi:hypothetical protein
MRRTNYEDYVLESTVFGMVAAPLSAGLYNLGWPGKLLLGSSGLAFSIPYLQETYENYEQYGPNPYNAFHFLASGSLVLGSAFAFGEGAIGGLRAIYVQPAIRQPIEIARARIARTIGQKVVLEEFSGPTSQINRYARGYRWWEAAILTVDIDTYGNWRIIKGDATNLFLPDNLVDEVFITNPYNESLRGFPDLKAQFRRSIYAEAARVLKDRGALYLSTTESNYYGKVVMGRTDIIGSAHFRPEIPELTGFTVKAPTEQFRSHLYYNRLHPALADTRFGRPDALREEVPIESMRTLILIRERK